MITFSLVWHLENLGWDYKQFSNMSKVEQKVPPIKQKQTKLESLMQPKALYLMGLGVEKDLISVYF